MGLPRQPFEIPLDGGLMTRGDKRAKSTPNAEALLNHEFDDLGGLRVRFPWGPTNTNIVGGGTITNARRLAPYGDGLVLFTDTAMYAWASQYAAWKLIGTHLAVACDEQPRFESGDDPLFVDRAELNGVIFYVWSTATLCYIAATDKATGLPVMSRTLVATTDLTVLKPRLVALDTKVLLFYVRSTAVPLATNQLKVVALDPANPSAGLASPTSLTTLVTTYDVAKVPGADTAVVAYATSVPDYRIATVTAALAVTSSTKLRATGAAIAVAVTPDGVSAQVVRDNTLGHLFGDLITVSSLADVHINQDLGAPLTGGSPENIALAYRSVKDSGQYRCYWFETDQASTGSGAFFCRYGWVDDGGTVGLPSSPFVTQLSVASRAFEYGGHVFVWLVFGGASQTQIGSPSPNITLIGALQNTYFLYRDDGLLVAKSGDGSAALPSVQGVLPGVALVSGTTGYAWCGTERRIVPISETADAYTARAPLDVTFSFDDNRARRTAQLGNTLYIAGGLVLQCDAAQVVELGFVVYPWAVAAFGTTGGTNVVDGAYGLRFTYRWDNAQGERDRSTTATTATITLSGGPQALNEATPYCYVTRKLSPAVAVEAWRTKLAGSIYYRSTSADPTSTGNNRYVANDPTTGGVSASLVDNLADAVLGTQEEFPETAGTLPALPPPAANIIVASDTRLFLADVAGSPDTVWYSMQRQDGHVASFNDALTFNVPSAGGAITAIDQFEGGIIVWRETATYIFSGVGFDNTGGGANFTLSRIVSTTSGAESFESVTYGDSGWFVRTNNGWYLLDKAFNYSYVGAGIYAYDSEPVLASQMLTGRQQFRVVTANRVLMLDTLVNRWAEWTISDGLDMISDSSSRCWYLTPSGAREELTTWSGYGATDTSLTSAVYESAWIKPDGRQQGRYIIDFLQLLGEFRSTCALQIQLAKDYEYSAPGVPNWHTTQAWTPDVSTDGTAIKLRIYPTKKRCAAIKVRITVAAGIVSPLTGPSVRLTSLTGQYATETGATESLAAAEKA